MEHGSAPTARHCPKAIASILGSHVSRRQLDLRTILPLDPLLLIAGRPQRQPSLQRDRLLVISQLRPRLTVLLGSLTLVARVQVFQLRQRPPKYRGSPGSCSRQPRELL